MATVGPGKVEEFLALPLTAHLATVGPRVRPVWFLWEDGAFWVLSGPWSTVPRDIETDPHVALVVDVSDVDTGEAKQVVSRGVAELCPWDADRAWRMLRRYLGDDVAAWDVRFRSYMLGENGGIWVRLVAERLQLVDLSFEPSRRLTHRVAASLRRPG